MICTWSKHSQTVTLHANSTQCVRCYNAIARSNFRPVFVNSEFSNWSDKQIQIFHKRFPFPAIDGSLVDFVAV